MNAIPAPFPVQHADGKFQPGSRAFVFGLVIALHLLAGWLLLRMVILPQPDTAPRVLSVSWFAPEQRSEPPQAPPPPPRQRIKPTASPVIAATPTPQAAPASFEVAPDPTPPAPDNTQTSPSQSTAQAAVAQPRNVAISELVVRIEPRPEWPRLSVKLNEQGRVLVRFLIDTNGKVAQAYLHQSSGFERLDRAAVRAVERAEFKPYMEAGRAIQAWAIYPIEFKLE